MIKELVKKNRSYRRFHQDVKIEENTLKELVDLARLSPSGSNMQPLKYIISCDDKKNELIFETLKWAGYLHDWHGPEEGEKPSAYIIVLCDKSITENYGVDPGIVMQTMLIGAAEKDLGGCMFGSIDRDKLRENLSIPEQFNIAYVVALGKPKENVVIVDADDSIRYYRDEDQTHYVPKRRLDELILKI